MCCLHLKEFTSALAIEFNDKQPKTEIHAPPAWGYTLEPALNCSSI